MFARRTAVALALSVIASAPTHAQNHAIAAGGGCVDLAKGQEYFEQENRLTADTYGSIPGWSSERLFGEEFTSAHLLASLGFRRNLKTGKIEPLASPRFGAGDQVVLSIGTHGTSDGARHSICVEDDDAWNVRNLKPALDALAARGVRILVTDTSCFGGGSVRELAGPNVCVVSGTLDTVTGYGADVSTSMTAQLGLTRVPEPRRTELLARYGAGSVFNDRTRFAALSTNQPDIDGDGSLSAEELFLTDRVMGAFGMDAGPAQISSDVGGTGFEVARSLRLLEDAIPNPGSGARSDTPDSVNAFYENILSNPCPGGGPFAATEEFFAEISGALGETELADERRLLADAIRRVGLGRRTLARIRSDMAAIVAERARIYQDIRAATGRFNAIANADTIDTTRLAAARAELERLSIRDARSLAGDRLRKLERVYYLAQYLKQRRNNREHPNARACSDFRL